MKSGAGCMKNNEPLLEVKSLKKFFPIMKGIFRHHTGDVKAVNGIDFTIRKNEVLGVVGESGCGKSTAGRTAIRLTEPTEGQILFDGKDFLKVKDRELKAYRKHIQIVFQNPYASLNPRKTIAGALEEILQYHKPELTPRNREDRMSQVLQQVGLSPDALELYPHEFSGGQQQRICIARAIILKPRLIILDEAVSALDVSIQAQVLNLLHDLKRELNLSYLFISHDLSVIRHICDRIVVMYLGKIVETSSSEKLFSNPKHPYTQMLLSAIPKNHPDEKKTRNVYKGEIPTMITPPSGCPFNTRCPYAQETCYRKFPDKKIVDDDHEYFCIL